jgi:hypothetical protein
MRIEPTCPASARHRSRIGARTHFVAGLLAAASGAGCAAADDSADRVVRRDSAGVEIVETAEPVWPESAAWRVEPEPLLVIGRTVGDENYLFGQISGVVRLADGTIVVADGQSGLISYYDSDGIFLRNVGGPGGGPEEFNRLFAIWPCGRNAIHAHDRGANRVKVWDGDGRFVRDFALVEPGQPGRGPYRTACSPSGGFLVAGWGDLSQAPRDRTQFYSQSAPIWFLDEDGQEVVNLGEYVISDRIAIVRNGGGGSGPHPFGRSASFALSDSMLFIGAAERLDVQVYDRTGRMVRSVRGPAVDLSIDETLLDRHAASELTGSAGDMIELVREQDLEMPAGYAAYSELIVDPDQNIWAKRFQFPWEPASRWAVFASDGSFLGHVDMPAGLTVHQIGPDWILGVSRDELDVQRVALHRLDRAGSVVPGDAMP